MEERFDIYYDSTYKKTNGGLELVSEACPLTQIEHHVNVDAYHRGIKGEFRDINYMYKLSRYTGQQHPMGFPDTEPVEWDEIFSECNHCESYVLDHELYNGACDYCQDEVDKE